MKKTMLICCLLLSSFLAGAQQQTSETGQNREWLTSFTAVEVTAPLDIKFVHADGKEVPTHQDRNCGYTLIGKAKSYIKANKALTTPGEPSDDQEYVYINEHSTLTYVGETGDHTLYVRVYDNLSGTNNDRWAVVYLD